MQVAAKTSDDDVRKRNCATNKLAGSATVYNWLKKRGKTVKKIIDMKTRKDMKEVRAWCHIVCPV
jgi:hypothetical protein